MAFILDKYMNWLAENPEDFKIDLKLANMIIEMINDKGDFFLFIPKNNTILDETATTKEWTLILLCSDTFGWGEADGENIPLDKIEEVYNIWKENVPFALTKWVCYRRKERPQNYIDYKDRLNGFEWTDEDEEKIK